MFCTKYNMGHAADKVRTIITMRIPLAASPDPSPYTELCPHLTAGEAWVFPQLPDQPGWWQQYWITPGIKPGNRTWKNRHEHPVFWPLRKPLKLSRVSVSSNKSLTETPHFQCLPNICRDEFQRQIRDMWLASFLWNIILLRAQWLCFYHYSSTGFPAGSFVIFRQKESKGGMNEVCFHAACFQFLWRLP